jgi:ubiquinone/menaquinone biosynthesis C-methylase UbiE
MPFEAGEFDALVMVRAALHLTDLNAAAAEIARVLKSGGVAVIELANKRSLAEITRRFCGRSALHPFSLEPESRGTTGFYYFHPHYAERIFERNGLRVKKTLAVTGIRRHVRTKFFTPLLYALEYLLQYMIGGFKWSPSLYYLLVRE